MNVVADVVVPLGITLLGGGGIAAVVVKGWFRRPIDQATAAQILLNAGIKQVNELQERVAEAEQATNRARTETDGLRTQVHAARNEAEKLAQTLYDLRMAIFRPGMTIEKLRELLGGMPMLGTAQPTTEGEATHVDHG